MKDTDKESRRAAETCLTSCPDYIFVTKNASHPLIILVTGTSLINSLFHFVAILKGSLLVNIKGSTMEN